MYAARPTRKWSDDSTVLNSVNAHPATAAAAASGGNHGSERVADHHQWAVDQPSQLLERGDHVQAFCVTATERGPEVEAERCQTSGRKVVEHGVDHRVEAVTAVVRVGVTHDGSAVACVGRNDHVG